MSKHQTILDAAQTLFGRYGLKKVTTDDIAREAHVSKATIYLHYRNKQEILKAVIRHEMDELLSKVMIAIEAEDTVEGKLRAHLQTKIAIVHQLINLHNVTSESMADYWDQAPVLRNQFMAEETRIIQEILHRGMETGELEIENVAVTAHFMMVSLNSLECPWVIEGLALSVDEQVDIMLGILLNGLRRR